MPTSTWVYDCELGLHQSTCGKHQKDPAARGAGRWSGCPSCIHRVPANDTTRNADATFAAKHAT